MGFRFSEISENRLVTCDPRIQEIMGLAIQRSSIDFGIAEGHRTLAKQQQYFAEEKSQKDGIINKSKHQSFPSLAVDIYGWVNGKQTYNTSVMCYLAGVIDSVASELGFNLIWGANWDDDGEIITDHKFIDMPHWELTV